MARYAESVYCLNLGGPRATEVSPSGDGTIWAERDPSGSFTFQRVEATANRNGAGEASAMTAPPRVVAEARVEAAEGRLLDELIESLPPGGVFPARGCDGLHRRLIVSTPAQIECYFWWAFDEGDEPALRTLERIVALLERWLPRPPGPAAV